MEHKVPKHILLGKDQEGTTVRFKWDTENVTVVFNVKTAVECPPEDEKCVVKLCLGNFGD